MEKRRIEILAPAGSYASFKAAINAGADAVYAGGPKFGARAYADNFTKVRVDRSDQRSSYIRKKALPTVNTLLKNTKFQSYPNI